LRDVKSSRLEALKYQLPRINTMSSVSNVQPQVLQSVPQPQRASADAASAKAAAAAPATPAAAAPAVSKPTATMGNHVNVKA